MEKAAPEQAERIEAVLAKGEELTKDELFAVLPDGKLFGAHLSQSTMVHWVYAAVATTGFLLLILLMFSVERSNPLHLLGIGLFTGTVGIVFLLVVQFCSQIDIRSLRVRGWFGLILLILALIGWSYRSALDEDSNLLLSAIGFTFGVGLCEELTKAIPLLFYYNRFATMGWRGACLWGLASGIGFGVSEGIMYSADSYNGIAGAGAYVVRFISCVAIHAMWAERSGSRSPGRSISTKPSRTGSELASTRWCARRANGIARTLRHAAEEGYEHLALLIAIASFGWLAFQIEKARGDMPEGGTPIRESLGRKGSIKPLRQNKCRLSLCEWTFLRGAKDDNSGNLFWRGFKERLWAIGSLARPCWRRCRLHHLDQEHLHQKILPREESIAERDCRDLNTIVIDDIAGATGPDQINFDLTTT